MQEKNKKSRYGFSILTCFMEHKVVTKARKQNIGSWQLVRKKKRNKSEWRGSILGVWLAMLLVITCTASYADRAPNTQTYDIDIPATNAAEALNKLAEQADVVLLFPYKDAKSRQANAVVGRYTLMEALRIMLQSSGLSGGLSENGTIRISITETEGHNDKSEGREAMNSNKSVLAAVIGFLFGVGGAQGAVEQDQLEENLSRVLEEIVVTATKRSESMQDVPISISAMTEADIINTGSQNLQDIADSVPNFVFPSSRQPSDAAIAIRGVFSHIFSWAIGFDGGYGVYLDGVYLGKNFASNADLGEVERVEVLRGPQGTLFGKNTIAGVINIVSKKPSEELEGKVEAGFGNNDLKTVKGSINIPIIENMLATRLSFNNTERDGYVTNTFLNEDDIGNIDRYAGRFQLVYTPIEKTEAYLCIDFGESDLNVYNFESVPDPDNTVPDADSQDFTISDNVLTRSTIENLGGSFTIEHNFDNGYTLTSTTGVREDKLHLVRDVDMTVIDGFTTNNKIWQEQWTQELRINSPTNGWYDYVAGLYYFKQENKKEYIGTVGRDWAPAFVGDFHSDTTVDAISYAAFVHANVHLTEQLALFGGLRYTDETKEMSIFQFSTPEDLNSRTGYDSGNIPIPVDVEDSEPSWTGGLRYSFDDNVQAYASVSRGVKSGAFNSEDLITDAILVDNLILKPEFVTNYEVGLKSINFGGHLRLNATIFYMEYEDQQVTVFDPNGGPNGSGAARWRNAASSTSKGFELELALRPTESISLNTGIGYTDATYDTFDGVPERRNSGSFVDAGDHQMPLAPEWTVNASIQHESPLSNGATWLTRLDYSYIDGRYAHQGVPNTPDALLPSRSLLNARVGYTSSDGIWEGHLWAKNITDETYVEEKVFFTFVLRRLQERYGEPRTYGISLTYNF